MSAQASDQSQESVELKRLRIAFFKLLSMHVGKDTFETAASYHQRDRTQSQLAEQYGVSQSAISQRIATVDKILLKLNAFPAEWKQSSPKFQRARLIRERQSNKV